MLPACGARSTHSYIHIYINAWLNKQCVHPAVGMRTYVICCVCTLMLVPRTHCCVNCHGLEHHFHVCVAIYTFKFLYASLYIEECTSLLMEVTVFVVHQLVRIRIITNKGLAVDALAHCHSDMEQTWHRSRHDSSSYLMHR